MPREKLQPRRWRCLMCPPDNPTWITSVGAPDRCETCGANGPFMAEDLADQLPRDGEAQA